MRTILHQNFISLLLITVCNTPDGIPQLFYKRFAFFLTEPLFIILSKSYDTGTVPSAFRETIVTPIFKKGPKSIVSNYRPVAQGCIAAKLLEKLISSHIQNFLSQHKVSDPFQYGFVPGRSTCLQLLFMTQEWASYFNSRKAFHCIYSRTPIIS